jgi:hypothetical protein
MRKFAAFIVLSLALVPPGARADAIYNFDGGPATAAGSVDVTLDWTNAAGPKSVKLTVPVAVGDTRDVIRNNVQAALKANAAVAADWTFAPDSAGLGKVYWTDGTPGAGVALTGAIIVPTPGKSPTGKLTISGGFTTAFANPPLNNWFLVTGIGTPGDAISVTLATPGDTNYANLQTFSLASYAGLNGDQIDQQLASLINQSGLGFSASIVNSEVFVSGINTQLGADMLISDAGDLQVTSAASVPEPGTAALLLSVAGLVLVRLFRRTTALRKN